MPGRVNSGGEEEQQGTSSEHGQESMNGTMNAEQNGVSLEKIPPASEWKQNGETGAGTGTGTGIGGQSNPFINNGKSMLEIKG